MDIWQVLVIGIRRWMVTIPLAILGFALAWGYSSDIRPTYSAEASLLYLPPSVSVSEVIDPAFEELEFGAEIVIVNNPFAGSLRSAALAGELYMNSQAVRDDLSEIGLSSAYEVNADRRNPVLYVASEADSPEAAVETIDELLVVVADDLRARQDVFGVDSREQVTVQVVTKDQSAIADFGARTRIRAIMFLLALASAFGVGVLVEGIVDFRSGRRPFSREPDAGVNTAGGTLTIQIPDSLAREMGGGTLTPLPRSVVDIDDDGRSDDASPTHEITHHNSPTRPRTSRWAREDRAAGADSA